MAKNTKSKEKKFDAYKVVKYPLSTEKSLRLSESENKLVFIVDLKATRTEVKKALEEMFNAKVEKVNIQITPKGLKKAYVKFGMDTPAIDIATNLGLM